MTSALLLGVAPSYADDIEETGLRVEPGPFDAALRLLDAHAQFGEVLAPVIPMIDALGATFAYTGFDAWRHGIGTYAGADLINGTFALRLFGATSLDEFRTTTEAYISGTMRASVLPGVHVRFGQVDVKAFAGVDYMQRLPLWPSLDPPMERYGGRVAIDVWWQPADTWMISGALSATTIERGITGRIASGWRSPFGWVGPELLATHDIYNTQLRAGGHISGLTLGFGEWSIAGGYAHDSFGRGGAYARLAVTLRPPLPEGF